MRNYDLEVPISKKNECLIKDDNKCITCGYCKRVCENEMTVASMFKVNPKREPICIDCGQCANVCPTEAIYEKFEYLKVRKILHSKKNKIIVFNIAPAVRVALGEEFGMKIGTNLEKNIPTALKKIGADYVFDVTFGADLTIMEEAMEFVDRIKNNKTLPQFTSCCPAWVKYAEIFYPELLPNLSTTKSPIAMQATIIKTYFAKKNRIKPENIVNILVVPCSAKKGEVRRKNINYTSFDTNYVLTTRELAMLLKEEKIDMKNLKESKFDSPFGTGSGAGVIFGVSGGVCEATLRTAYYFLTNKNLKKKDLIFQDIRGLRGIKEARIIVLDREIKVAVCNGMKNAKELIEKIKNNEEHYDFIEVMSCPGGCINGGGQPKIPQINIVDTKNARMNGLYREDERMKLRFCHENPDIKYIYTHYLKYPNSKIAKKLLHTKYEDKSYMLGGNR